MTSTSTIATVLSALSGLGITPEQILAALQAPAPGVRPVRNAAGRLVDPMTKRYVREEGAQADARREVAAAKREAFVAARVASKVDNRALAAAWRAAGRRYTPEQWKASQAAVRTGMTAAQAVASV